MSTADVAAPDLGPQEAEERESIWHRAITNVKSGNLGVLPVVLGEILIVTYFGFTATNFFTAGNFVNVILQMAGVTMIAFGVVFVLLIAEIDLSIGFLSGIAALTVAELQLPDGANLPGWLCILIALAVVAFIGALQGTFVAKVGVPSFVVTLAGLLIWHQGVILKVLQLRGVIIIEEDWVNKTATYYFSESDELDHRCRHHRGICARRGECATEPTTCGSGRSCGAGGAEGPRSGRCVVRHGRHW